MIVEHRTYTSSKAYFIPSSVKFHSLLHVLALYMYSNSTGVLLPDFVSTSRSDCTSERAVFSCGYLNG
jgi:hypothetical protein